MTFIERIVPPTALAASVRETINSATPKPGTIGILAFPAPDTSDIDVRAHLLIIDATAITTMSGNIKSYLDTVSVARMRSPNSSRIIYRYLVCDEGLFERALGSPKSLGIPAAEPIAMAYARYKGIGMGRDAFIKKQFA